MPGLPFALFTQSMHFVPQALVRDGPVPTGVELQKYYFEPDIRVLQEQANEARSLGVAAAEEWYKGLPLRGQQAQNDAARFEQWESSRGLATAQTILFKPHSDVPFEENISHTGPILPNRPPVAVAPLPVGNQHMPLPVTLPPMRQYGVPPGVETPYVTPPIQSDSVSMGSQKSTGTHKASKGSRERARIRSYKKQDIIARCSKLTPPISRDMLERLDAFDAALQVPMPLNESSWETLKGRLLHQRHKAVLEDEAKNAARTAPIPGQFRPPSRSDDFMLAQADTSRREKLCQIAEEFIKQKYGYGGWVTFPNSPQFAADVLIHTRQRYLDEEARIRNLQALSGTVMFEESLKLEDMKWVFEQTIKPRTEQIRKDLFVCPECPVQGNVKHFAFESIIQHYASKHTTAFSIGNQKVSWKADWPATPPFTAHPERVHTPTPSITHTPTLSHQPLSTMSPGSVMTSTIPSAGRQSPDTMSLMSNTTNTYSVAGSSINRYAIPAFAPGYGMYEAQRDMLSTELLRGWRMIPSTLSMSDSLRLHIAIAVAGTNFNFKYRNQPSLDLFSDCINTKVELRELHDMENLRCAECIITGSPQSRAMWTLQDLIIHFRKAHVDYHLSASKPDWRNDMVALPEPEFIKDLQADPSLTQGLKELFQDAVTTSTLKSVQSNIPVLDLAPRANFPHPPTYGAGTRQTSYDHQRHYFPGLGGARAVDAYGARKAQPRQVISSVAASYGDGVSARDSWSATTRTIKDEELSDRSFRTRPRIETRDQQPRSADQTVSSGPQEVNVRPRDQDIDMSYARGETMSRSETVRSYHSRGGLHVTSAVDDFLSTIDAHVDVEMAESGGGQPRSARTSRPVSRSNSAVDSSINATKRDLPDFAGRQTATSSRPPFSRIEQAPAHEPELTRVHGSRSEIGPFPRDARAVQPEIMDRQPSTIVEFDHHGTPVPRTGLVYHETSPPVHLMPRPRFDTYRRSSEHLTYPRGPPPGLREVPPERIRYADEPIYSEYPYQNTEYVQAPAYRPDRIYDAATGQHYVAERPPTRQYPQVDDRPRRVQTLYDERGRLVQYVELGSVLERREEPYYERYPSDQEERRYEER